MLSAVEALSVLWLTSVSAGPATEAVSLLTVEAPFALPRMKLPPVVPMAVVANPNTNAITNANPNTVAAVLPTHNTLPTILPSMLRTLLILDISISLLLCGAGRL